MIDTASMGRPACDLRLEPVQDSCRIHGHMSACAMLLGRIGDSSVPAEVCPTCTKRAGGLDGLRWCQDAHSCCSFIYIPPAVVFGGSRANRGRPPG